MGRDSYRSWMHRLVRLILHFLNMNAKYDTTTVKVTPRFKRALKELMAAQCEMMAQAEPEYADCWTWGNCKIADLSSMRGLQFTFGGDDDKPKGARFTVSA